MSQYFLLILVVLFSFSSCDNLSNSKEKPVETRVNKKDSSDEVMVYSKDHEEMNIAQMEARKTYPEFLKALQNGCKGCEHFFVKMRFSYGDGNGEHIWIEDLRIVNGKVWGLIANIPENIKNLKYRDTVEVIEKDLSDWKYVQNGKLIGGYTLRVIYKKMSDKEKIQLESDLGVKIE
jgi:uncharacterized protein YegJ (DUF2314 family)